MGACGKPVLAMRDATERPEAVEAETALLVGTDPERIVSVVNRLLNDSQACLTKAEAHNPYGDENAAIRITTILITVHQ